MAAKAMSIPFAILAFSSQDASIARILLGETRPMHVDLLAHPRRPLSQVPRLDLSMRQGFMRLSVGETGQWQFHAVAGYPGYYPRAICAVNCTLKNCPSGADTEERFARASLGQTRMSGCSSRKSVPYLQISYQHGLDSETCATFRQFALNGMHREV